jgi:hypothetical protein
MNFMGNFTIKYTELFSFSLEQLFYENNYCKKYSSEPKTDLQYIPTEECIDTMNRLGLLFRKTDYKAGFTVYARTAGNNISGNYLIRNSPANYEKLTFWLILNNQAVINFNNLPAEISRGEFFYFSNQITDPSATRSNLHLTRDVTGVVGANDTSRKYNQNYRFHHTARVVENTAKVKHNLTGIEIDPKYIINIEGESDLIFDLYSLPLGKCKLLINNVQKDEFYYLGSAVLNSVVFGIIEISLSKTLGSNYRVIEPDFSLTAERPYYKVRFINRETFWRYTIKLQPNSPLYLEITSLSPTDKADFINTLNIVTNDTNITFSKTPVSDKEFVFLSDNVVALKEKYVSSTSSPPKSLKLTLKKYVGIPLKETTVKTDLPYPSLDFIDILNYPLVYSDIYLII